MNRCLGTKQDNSPCTVAVEPPQNYCWWHDPANAEQRKQAASRGGKRGGRGRPMAELHSIRDRLKALAEDVLGGRVDRGDAAVVGQLYNTLIRAVSVELKVREVTELEERLEELEVSLERQNRGRHYGGA
jgi:hypothetical protein